MCQIVNGLFRPTFTKVGKAGARQGQICLLRLSANALLSGRRQKYTNRDCGYKLEPCGLEFLTSVRIGFGFLRKCRFLVGIGFRFRFFRFFFFFCFFLKFYVALTDLLPFSFC
jgi:hypothetical protein